MSHGTILYRLQAYNTFRNPLCISRWFGLVIYVTNAYSSLIELLDLSKFPIVSLGTISGLISDNVIVLVFIITIVIIISDPHRQLDSPHNTLFYFSFIYSHIFILPFVFTRSKPSKFTDEQFCRKFLFSGRSDYRLPILFMNR